MSEAGQTIISHPKLVNELLDAKIEIDRLRAEKAAANNQWRLDYNACAAERDRLRAENERLRETLDNVRQYIVEDIPEWALAAIRKGLFPD